ncbi:hypothetical protein [Halorussus halophilus]|uniref:hypothetical protein n=1 Tax=Halorussus halophilus TaxID=2650975 RepID=UPI001300E6CE|nr:hypothetical protein [Halorussus halophilus]
MSPHTVQINGWVSLAKDRRGFSHSLARYEYECDLIESEMEVADDIVHPDVVLTSGPNNHSIVAECKSKTLDEDQLRRYQLLEGNSDTLLQNSSLDSLVDSSIFKLETCYSSLSDLSTRKLLVNTDTTFVQFKHSPSSGVLIKNSIEFDSTTLASAFPINMDPDEALPTEYYPFDVDQQEDSEQFVSTVIQALLRAALVKDTTDIEEVLEEVHFHWNHISDEKQDRFITETEHLLQYLKRKELQGYIENVADAEGKWRVSAQTAQALQDRMEGPEFVEKIAQEISPQTSLAEY